MKCICLRVSVRNVCVPPSASGRIRVHVRVSRLGAWLPASSGLNRRAKVVERHRPTENRSGPRTVQNSPKSKTLKTDSTALVERVQCPRTAFTGTVTNAGGHPGTTMASLVRYQAC
jgi:hypothetical protein